MKRSSIPLAAACALSVTFASCGGGGGGSSSGSVPIVPPVVQSPSPNPGGSPAPASVTCPTTGSSASSIAASGGSADAVRRTPMRDDGSNRYVPGLYTVTYDTDARAAAIDALASQEGAVRTAARFDALGLRMRALSVDPSRASEFVAKMKAMPGVISVQQAQYRRLAAITANDPYYKGFGPGSPYYESSTVPGQWDMHVINVAGAWSDYSSTPVVGAAIAIVDTGVDVTHPEMGGGRVIRQACYVTYPSNAAQTTGNFATDADGHGTDVAGIADDDTNNNFGFAGVAYDAPLLAYRIFPTPPSGGCTSSSTSAQCDTTDVDEASAINDAVAHNARVINLSLGATPPCNDPTEENAVEAAIAHNVVVVAAAGNEGNSSLDCPAAYPGVIAVGAEGPSGSSETEAVASYSNYLSGTGTTSGGAYLVAPGGTASSASDADDLHFVENITSSQSADAATYCHTDYAGETNDCRAGYAGTSQATPHVTGVVSLMLGLRPSLTPAQIAGDLCSTAHSIGDAKQGCGRVDAAAAVAKALTQ